MNYIPHKRSEVKKMLKVIGKKSIEDLFEDIPGQLKKTKFNLPTGLGELQLIRLAHKLAGNNALFSERLSFLGAGAYEHFIPSVVGEICSLAGFLTAYTPYQAEASQGTLRTMIEFQTLVRRLTGMEVSNASLYDGATALTEAAAMALSITGKNQILVAKTLHPEYRKVLKTSLKGLNVQILELHYSEEMGIIDPELLKQNISQNTAAILIQQPNFFGCLEQVEEIEKIAHENDSLFVVCQNPISFGILKRPGDYDADIVVGEGQPLGIPLNFGGPYLGLFASKMKWVRQMPGRLAGRKDKDGKMAFTLVLQSREQHIRRERATSNICTNSNLNALAFVVRLSLLGTKGLRELAEQNLQTSHYLQEKISQVQGFKKRFSAPFFNEFVLRTQIPPEELNEKLLDRGIIGGLDLGRYYPELKDCLLFCATETKEKEDIDYLVSTLLGETKERKSKSLIFDKGNPETIPQKPVEELLGEKFIQSIAPKIPKLSEKKIKDIFVKRSELNYSIDTHDGYYLGSCTMKLNPKVNEALSGLPRFLLLHPYQPEKLVQGTLQILYETDKIISEICGMKKFSLQPAAGAHGELTGISIIRAFHQKQGDPRKVIIIPDSAHGTNPASAARCGYDIVIVKSTADGEIDIEDLAKKVNEETAGLMITLPNTLGLFERRILEITEIIHKAGGLVYMDGANMNAFLGVVKPGEMGIDILHLNLHKTFSAPHGGGGPGSGPVGAVEKLVPFLPVPIIEKDNERYFLNYDLPDSIGKVSTFYGNVNVAIKSYLYLRTLGQDLKKVAQYAVLNANYLRVLLKEHYLLPYDRDCMHEFVLSLRKLGPGAALIVLKRLLDYHFHSPTGYFPLIVSEALMIEPTETEDKKTLDKFVKVMIKILREMEENLERVKGAPYTTPVGRIDQAGADRNPILSWED